jgi:hypothetical protein
MMVAFYLGSRYRKDTRIAVQPAQELGGRVESLTQAKEACAGQRAFRKR